MSPCPKQEAQHVIKSLLLSSPPSSSSPNEQSSEIVLATHSTASVDCAVFGPMMFTKHFSNRMMTASMPNDLKDIELIVEEQKRLLTKRSLRSNCADSSRYCDCLCWVGNVRSEHFTNELAKSIISWRGENGRICRG